MKRAICAYTPLILVSIPGLAIASAIGLHGREIWLVLWPLAIAASFLNPEYFGWSDPSDGRSATGSR